MQASNEIEQLKWMRLLGPVQRQILSDMCRGAQVVSCHDGTYRACIEIACASRLSAYGLTASSMTRLCAVVWQIRASFCDPHEGDDSAPDGYGFHYLPARDRLQIAEFLTLTTRAPKAAFVSGVSAKKGGTSNDDGPVIAAFEVQRNVVERQT